ncbi:MAG TPA: UDP-N-acetylmuramoyl-L-alanyl-D-glutamate--2,6-diaminopimelate ligase [Candidatus Saccharimonadales bacterium]|nr:UDP-N-acetylmuramoyl-L-alanyl-D-glutamate--2,6-diaminopimelate ligase [Candidatus Saccharimonadales bacterium]
MRLLKKLLRRLLPVALLRLVEKSYRLGRGLFWQARFGFPARGLRVIAVTGTNGKTTTISYINEILKAAGYKTAALSTVFYEVDGKITPNTTHFTIDKQSIVQSFMHRAKKAGVDFVVLEVTSHALDQDRMMGVKAEVAVITNLTQDHLDYHRTMENYAHAKSLLLRNFGAKYAVLNGDDKWFDYFKGAAKCEVFEYGKGKTARLKIGGIKLSASGSRATFETDGGKLAVKTGLPGEFNVYNAAAAAAAGVILGLTPKKIELGISGLKGLSGRMEEIDEGQNYRVLVDFAITPDALEKALTALNKTAGGSVRLVFGATGDRDKGKRPDMGRVAGKLADAVYLTDDETYTEDAEKIRSEVFSGIKDAGAAKKTRIIPDRAEAIAQAFKDSKKGDAVLIAGLGHENSRNMGGKLIPWSDQETARKLLHI